MQDVGVVEVQDVPEPELDPAGAMLRVQACGICGTDARTFFNGDPRAPTPWLLGHEPVGILEEAGPQAALPLKVSPGNRVFLASILTCQQCKYCLEGRQNICKREELYGYRPHRGAYAEFAAIPPIAVRNIFPVPADLPSYLATVADPLACALNGVEILDPRIGDSVVIIGGGPIGCMQAALVRNRGAGRIYLLESSRDRLELALSVIGQFVDDAWVPEPDNGAEAVLRRTEGRGAERVMVAAPSAAAQQAALVMAGRGSRVVYFAGLPKSRPVIDFDANQLHYKELSVHGAYGATPRQYRIALDLLERQRGYLERIVTHQVALEHIDQAFQAIKDGSGLKAVILP